MSPIKKTTKSNNSNLLKSVFCGFNETFNEEEDFIQFIPKLRKGIRENKRKEKNKGINLTKF